MNKTVDLFIIAFILFVSIKISEPTLNSADKLINELFPIISNSTSNSIQQKAAYGNQCFSNSECSGVFQKCVDNWCRCTPNYRWDNKFGLCTYNVCKTDRDCQDYDKYRFCNGYDFMSHVYSYVCSYVYSYVWTIYIYLYK